jgi:hypothetical protein
MAAANTSEHAIKAAIRATIGDLGGAARRAMPFLLVSLSELLLVSLSEPDI